MYVTLQKQKGFTIVELLIVVVVIAILAAITIVAYNGITNRAKESAVASMASQVYKKVAIFGTLNSEQYPNTLAEAGVDAATVANVQYSVNNFSSPKGFCITASQNGTSSYVAKNYSYTTTTTQVADQTSPQTGTCPGHSLTNGALTANLVYNPALRPTTPTNWSAVSSTGGVPSGTRVSLVSGLGAIGVTTAYRNTLGGTASTWWRVQNTLNVAVTPGESYVLSGYIRPSVNTSTGVNIIWETAGGPIENPSAFAAQTAGTWVRKSVVAVAPAGTTAVRLQFAAVGSGVSGAYLDATAAMFYPGTDVYAYADGNSNGWIWDGAADASSSKGPTL